MKKVGYVLLALLFVAALAQAQYPLVTVRQIQEVPVDSLLAADAIANFSANSTQTRWTLQTSPYMGDTVTVIGLCAVPPGVITYTATGNTMVLYDTGAASQWGGLFVRVNVPDSVQLLADGFYNVEPGDIITMTGFISEFPTSRGTSLTQFQPVPGHPVSIIGSGALPKPIVKNVGDFYTGTFSSGKVQYATGEPFEAMYVEFHNLTVDNKVNTTNGTFSAVDGSGNQIADYDWSHYFSLRPAFLDTNWRRTYTNLGIGMRIDTLRGIISTASGSEGPRGYRISPLYPGDIVFGIAPPLITTHRRNPVVVAPDSTPVVSVRATAQTGGAVIQSVLLNYSANGGAFTPLTMSFTPADTSYKASIPALPTGTMVRYYVVATDDSANTGILANSSTTGASIDTSKGYFFYTVLNRGLTIADVQNTPYVNGRSGYLGAVTPLSGIITADTSLISLNPLSNGGTNAWYMQSGNAPWSGIWLTATDTAALRQMKGLRAGDSVTVTGTVQEQFDVTRLGNITPGVTVVSSGNVVPAPLPMTTGAFNVGNGAASAEPYEGMLVRFTKVHVSDLAPTFSDATEFSVNDGSGAVIVRRDGMHRFSNLVQDTASGKTILHLGDTLSTLTGVIYYSFNQYKIVPRNDADFGSITVDVEPVPGNVLPDTYALRQNYPNPFNPSSRINYSLPTAGPVTLKVYDLLGREITTLVNQDQPAGEYTVLFRGESLSSGVYFYRLQAGNFVAMKKMMLVK